MNRIQSLLTAYFVCVLVKVMRCSKIASVKVSEITELINRALSNDLKAR